MGSAAKLDWQIGEFVPLNPNGPIELDVTDSILECPSTVVPYALKKKDKWPPKLDDPENATYETCGGFPPEPEEANNATKVEPSNRIETNDYIAATTVASLTNQRPPKTILTVRDFFKSSAGEFMIGLGLSRVMEWKVKDDIKRIKRQMRREGGAGDLVGQLERQTGVLHQTETVNQVFKIDTRHQCPHCKFRTESAVALERHLFHPHVNSRREYRCNWCSYKIKDSKQMVFHNHLHHKKRCYIDPPLQSHECSMCPYESNSKAKCANHMARCAKTFIESKTQAFIGDGDYSAVTPKPISQIDIRIYEATLQHIRVSAFNPMRAPRVYSNGARQQQIYQSEDIEQLRRQQPHGSRTYVARPQMLRLNGSSPPSADAPQIIQVLPPPGQNAPGNLQYQYTTKSTTLNILGHARQTSNQQQYACGFPGRPGTSGAPTVTVPTRQPYTQAGTYTTGSVRALSYTSNNTSVQQTLAQQQQNLDLQSLLPLAQAIRSQQSSNNRANTTTIPIVNLTGEGPNRSNSKNSGATSNSTINNIGNNNSRSVQPAENEQLSNQLLKNSTFVICEICDGYIKDLDQLKTHMQWIHKVKIHQKMLESKPPLNCQKCQWRFFTDQGLERHLLGAHGLVTSNMQEQVDAGVDAGRCTICGRAFSCKLVAHMKEIHKTTLKPAHLSYKCTVCSATFNLYRLFENHVYSVHSESVKRAAAVANNSSTATSSASPAKRVNLGQSENTTNNTSITPNVSDRKKTNDIMKSNTKKGISRNNSLNRNAQV